MGGVIGSGGTIEAPRVSDIQIQTSSYGRPVPVVYGANRVAANLIWYDDFTATEHSESTGGKGGAPEQVSYAYTASVILAICEGPILSIGKVWKDGEKGTLSKYGFVLLKGNRTQNPWAWLSQNHAGKALGYAGTALACAQALDLGSDGTLRNFSFEVRGFSSIPEGTDGSPDANAADIIPDIVTSPDYGAGWDAERVDDLALYRSYCTAAGFWISPLLSDQKELGEQLKDILKATNSEVVWSGGILKVIPYEDAAITAHGATFSPDVTPAYDLTYDDFITSKNANGAPESSADPVSCERISQADTWNSIPIRYSQRSRNYNEQVAEDPDNADVEAFGLRKGEPVELRCITREPHALAVSRILVNRSLYRRNRYKFRLGWKYALLEPMDFVTLTDDVLGLDHQVVRITEITETEDGDLEVRADEWPFSGVPQYAEEEVEDDAEPDPGDVDAPVIFEPPAMYASGNVLLCLAASGAGEHWGGCEVWGSEDGSSYFLIGRMTGPSVYGTLTADLDARDGLDTVNVLGVDISATGQILASHTERQRDACKSACWIDGDDGGEMVSYKTATLTGAGLYNLTSLQRGVYGDDPAFHASGSAFVRLNGRVLLYVADEEWVGQTIYIKLRSFNKAGRRLQALEDCTAYPYTIVGRSYKAPANVTAAVADALSRSVTVTWDYRTSRPYRLDKGFTVQILNDGDDPEDEGASLVQATPGRNARSYTLYVPSLPESADVFAAVRAEFNDGP